LNDNRSRNEISDPLTILGHQLADNAGHRPDQLGRINPDQQLTQQCL
jgi:hypothetical protein